MIIREKGKNMKTDAENKKDLADWKKKQKADMKDLSQRFKGKDWGNGARHP